MEKNPIEVVFPGENEVTAMLPKGTSLSLDGPVRGVTITCKLGAAWIVQQGDRRDHVLEAGWDFVATREGPIFVRTLKDARITIRLRDRSSGELLFSLSSDHRNGATASPPRWRQCCLASRRPCGRAIRTTVALSSP